MKPLLLMIALSLLAGFTQPSWATCNGETPLYTPGVLHQLTFYQERSGTSCGLHRTAQLYIPTSVNTQLFPTPLVIDLHPDETANWYQEEQSGAWQEYAEKYGVVVLQPNGGNVRFSTVEDNFFWGQWNAGPACCGPVRTDYPEGSGCGPVDDTGAIADNWIPQLINAPGLCIDEDRIHAQGFSNGAIMAQRLLCDRPDVFASVASAEGMNGYWTTGDDSELYKCHTQSGDEDNRAAQIIMFQGTEDHLVPSPVWSPGLNYWVGSPGAESTVNSCRTYSINYPNENLTCWEYTDCNYAPGDPGASDTVVQVCQGQWGHCWPNQYSDDPLYALCDDERWNDPLVEGVYTSDIFMQFFMDHPLPFIRHTPGPNRPDRPNSPGFFSDYTLGEIMEYIQQNPPEDENETGESTGFPKTVPDENGLGHFIGEGS